MLTKPDELLLLMQDGTPYTLQEIVEATGMSEKTARNTVYRLTHDNLLTAKPVCYRVTPQASEVINELRAKD